eukprot:gene9505-1711_t
MSQQGGNGPYKKPNFKSMIEFLTTKPKRSRMTTTSISNTIFILGAPFFLGFLYYRYRSEEKKEELRSYSTKDTAVKQYISNFKNKIQPSIEKFRNFVRPKQEEKIENEEETNENENTFTGNDLKNKISFKVKSLKNEE